MVAVVFNRCPAESFARHVRVLVPLPSLKQRWNCDGFPLRCIWLLALFARINSLRNFAEQFLGLGACFTSCLLADCGDFETNRETLLAFPDVALNHKCFCALTNEHRKSREFRVSSKI